MKDYTKIGNFLLQALIFGVIFYGIHWIIAIVFEQQAMWEKSYYSLQQIHLFEFLATAIMTALIVYSKKILPESLGFVFLALLTIKQIVNYLFISPALELETSGNFLKANFLVVFLVYMIFDVYVCYRLLNEKK